MFHVFKSYFAGVSPHVLSPELSSIPLSRWHFLWGICQFDISWIIYHSVKIKELYMTYPLSLINQSSSLYHFPLKIFSDQFLSIFITISSVQILSCYPWIIIVTCYYYIFSVNKYIYINPVQIFQSFNPTNTLLPGKFFLNIIMTY